jgi:hypothetical protein
MQLKQSAIQNNEIARIYFILSPKDYAIICLSFLQYFYTLIYLSKRLKLAKYEAEKSLKNHF